MICSSCGSNMDSVETNNGVLYTCSCSCCMSYFYPVADERNYTLYVRDQLSDSSYNSGSNTQERQRK